MIQATPIKLLKRFQKAVYNDPARFIAWIAGRQIGKSFTGAMRAVSIAKTKAKTDVLIASPSERQSLEAVAKCKLHVEGFGLIEQIEEIVERDRKGALMRSDTIIFPNGSRIIAVPGKPDTVRGFSAHVWMDEFAFFEDPDATWKAILPSITNPLKGQKTAFLTSTPNGKAARGKRFYEIVTDHGALDPEKMPPQYMAGSWSVHRTPITLAAPELGTDIEELRKAVDDDEAWNQEFLARFIDASNVLLPYDLMATCESADASLDDPVLYNQRGVFYAGVDFGRTNDPTVCWILEKVGDVLWTRKVIVLKNTSTVDQFALLEPILRHCTYAALDYTGPGIGFGDMAAHTLGQYDPSKHTFGRCELCTFTVKFKREIFPLLRRQFEAKTIRIPVDVDVREDLHEMQQIVVNGEYNYMARRTAEGHSDRCTALALAVHAASHGGAYVKPFAARKRRDIDARTI